MWFVLFSSKAAKQYKKLPIDVRFAVDALVMEIQLMGPVRGNWQNYSKLGSNKHHCHIRRGRPTYVACWKIIDAINLNVEVYYVGTHEKAPY